MKAELTQINLKLKELIEKMERLNEDGWQFHLEGQGNGEVAVIGEIER